MGAGRVTAGVEAAGRAEPARSAVLSLPGAPCVRLKHGSSENEPLLVAIRGIEEL